MSQATLRVIARLVARAGKEDALRSVLMGLIAPTRKESGCITYELLQNKENSGEFTFVEEWQDEAEKSRWGHVYEFDFKRIDW